MTKLAANAQNTMYGFCVAQRTEHDGVGRAQRADRHQRPDVEDEDVPLRRELLRIGDLGHAAMREVEDLGHEATVEEHHHAEPEERECPDPAREIGCEDEPGGERRASGDGPYRRNGVGDGRTPEWHARRARQGELARGLDDAPRRDVLGQLGEIERAAQDVPASRC